MHNYIPIICYHVYNYMYMNLCMVPIYVNSKHSFEEGAVAPCKLFDVSLHLRKYLKSHHCSDLCWCNCSIHREVSQCMYLWWGLLWRTPSCVAVSPIDSCLVRSQPLVKVSAHTCAEREKERGDRGGGRGRGKEGGHLVDSANVHDLHDYVLSNTFQHTLVKSNNI